MCIIDKYYHKIKYLILEYNNTLELDSKYMIEYLKDFQKDFNIDLINQDDILEETDLVEPTINNDIIKILYKKLARIFHPDKNNNDSENFIKINKAYEENDVLTLFIYSYENNFYKKNDITYNLILFLDSAIKKKEHEINEIKNKVHWTVINSNNDIEKELINEYIRSKLYDS